jgi:hypothetical protein
MADRPRDDTWWIASAGKWYPPTLQPDADAEAVSAEDPEPGTDGSTAVPHTLTLIVTTAIAATSGVFVVAGYLGLRYGSALNSASLSVPDRTSAEDVFLGWSSFALLALVVSGAVLLVWTFQTSKAFDARGASGRRWRGWWTIGAWFIPLASFVLPKLVFNEIEKIAQVPFPGEEIGERWKTESRSKTGDLWWLLWVVGLFMLQTTQVLLTDPAVDEGTIAIASSLSGVAHAVIAAAGVALVVVVRRIESSSRQ